MTKISRRRAALNRGIERSVVVLRNTPGIFQRVFIAATRREAGLFSRTNQFFHGIRSCNNFRGSCRFLLTYFPLSAICLVELDRRVAILCGKRIGANKCMPFAVGRTLSLFFLSLSSFYFSRRLHYASSHRLNTATVGD